MIERVSVEAAIAFFFIPFGNPPVWFSWNLFAVIALAYSAYVLFVDVRGASIGVFSHRSSRSIWQILLIHFVYLVVLLVLTRLGIFFLTLLPNWITNNPGSRNSPILVTAIIMGVVLAIIERRNLISEHSEPFVELEEESNTDLEEKSE